MNLCTEVYRNSIAADVSDDDSAQLNAVANVKNGFTGARFRPKVFFPCCFNKPA